MKSTTATAGVLRPFVPSKDFAESQSFYRTIGFHVRLTSRRIAVVSLDETHEGLSFLLQDFYVSDLAENLMLQMIVPDLAAWWEHLLALRLDERFGVKPPRAPAREAWGAEVAYFWDPSGVLWHIASIEEQHRKS